MKRHIIIIYYYYFSVNCHATGILKAEIYEKNGQKFMRFTDLTLDLNIDDYDIIVANLFDDEALSKCSIY